MLRCLQEATAARPSPWLSLQRSADEAVTGLGSQVAAADLETRDRRLPTLTAALALELVVVVERVADAWARLRVTLRDLGLRMPVNDSWIAAAAISLGVPVVTRDDDYVEVRG